MLLAVVCSVLFLPIFVSAKTTAVATTGTIDVSTLTTSNTRPTFTGTATSTKSVYLKIQKEGNSRTLYSSKIIKVKDGAWKSRITKKLPDGTYDVTLYGPKKGNKYILATETLRIGKTLTNTSGVSTTGALSVKSIPLLFGGNALPGTSVPVSYLQISNTSTKQVQLKGFWVSPIGSITASQGVIGLTTVDDRGMSRGAVGGVEGSSPFKNGQALVPTDVMFAPGEMRLFTIRATITKNILPYLGASLTTAVTGIESSDGAKGAFPIAGATWKISY